MSAEAAEVALWMVDLDRLDRGTLARNAALLTPAEADRARAFLREADRDRFIVGKALARRVVGSCLGLLPTDVIFAAGPFGRPELDPANTAARLPDGRGPDPRRLSFNLSHSGRLVVCAVSAVFDVGVDVEAVDRVVAIDDLAGTAMTEDERNTLRTVPRGQQADHFVRIWTLKEAYSKAVGRGLSLDFTSFGVEIVDAGHARLVPPAGDSAGAWALRSPEAPAGYRIGLAVRNQGLQVVVAGPLDGNAVLRHDAAATQEDASLPAGRSVDAR